jgi:hypothetical protein
MLTIENLPAALTALGFESKGQALEQKIADAPAVIAVAPVRKQTILQRYL